MGSLQTLLTMQFVFFLALLPLTLVAAQNQYQNQRRATTGPGHNQRRPTNTFPLSGGG